MTPPRRPNPFTSFEGCLLSQTLWAVFVMAGLFGGAVIGREVGGDMQGTTLGGLIGVTFLGFMPWRRWLVAWLRRREPPENGDSHR